MFVLPGDEVPDELPILPLDDVQARRIAAMAAAQRHDLLAKRFCCPHQKEAGCWPTSLISNSHGQGCLIPS